MSDTEKKEEVKAEDTGAVETEPKETEPESKDEKNDDDVKEDQQDNNNNEEDNDNEEEEEEEDNNNEEDGAPAKFMGIKPRRRSSATKTFAGDKLNLENASSFVDIVKKSHGEEVVLFSDFVGVINKGNAFDQRAMAVTEGATYLLDPAKYDIIARLPFSSAAGMSLSLLPDNFFALHMKRGAGGCSCGDTCACDNGKTSPSSCCEGKAKDKDKGKETEKEKGKCCSSVPSASAACKCGDDCKCSSCPCGDACQCGDDCKCTTGDILCLSARKTEIVTVCGDAFKDVNGSDMPVNFANEFAFSFAGESEPRRIRFEKAGGEEGIKFFMAAPPKDN